MIIDQIALAGEKSYLRSGPGPNVNLAAPPRKGRFPPAGSSIREGMALQVDGLTLQFEHDDLLSIYTRQAEPLISVEVVKEMFPGLFKDPYAHRVHRVSGFEDFSRGGLDGFRVLDVDGMPTLVSTGERSLWKSDIYQMSEKTSIDSVAWEIPASKLTPKESFTYSLRLYWWKYGQGPGQAEPAVEVLAENATPQADRFKDGLDARLSDVGAYGLSFKAEVKYDAALTERYADVGGTARSFLGRPLLTAVHLLEVVPSEHVYNSVQEIIENSSEYKLFEHPSGQPKRFSSRLEVTAMLNEGESISLKVQDNNPKFKYLEARVNGRMFLRPPRIDKEY